MNRSLALALAFVGSQLLLACASDDDAKPGAQPKPPSATETNVAPAPCKADSDCGDGGMCNPPLGPDQSRFCNVQETQAPTSSATPAPCSSNDDCGDEIQCVDGFCDVEEMVVSTPGPSSAAPAPCKVDSDCPNGIVCTHWSGANGPGFCNVMEHIAP
jgi:hypothetical protein